MECGAKLIKLLTNFWFSNPQYYLSDGCQAYFLLLESASEIESHAPLIDCSLMFWFTQKLKKKNYILLSPMTLQLIIRSVKMSKIGQNIEERVQFSDDSWQLTFWGPILKSMVQLNLFLRYTLLSLLLLDGSIKGKSRSIWKTIIGFGHSLAARGKEYYPLRATARHTSNEGGARRSFPSISFQLSVFLW